jgi:hypothetical protein
VIDQTWILTKVFGKDKSDWIKNKHFHLKSQVS